ncbi:MAG: hypothetical protein H7Z75_17725 [Ferruginibacter sp.]|nr:hypothetical protein [Cytophagales bacterium]
MKKYPFLFVGLLLGVLLAACSREREAIEPGKQYQNAFPLAVGNYWVYRTTITPSTGEKQIFNTVDSVWIEKDTTINGIPTFVQRSTRYHTLKTYLSDSADCIVSKTLQYRSIEFSTNFRDTLEREPPFYLMMLDANAETQVWAGIFRTVNCKSLIKTEPSDQRNWPMHDPIFMVSEQKLYANNVGLVKKITYAYGNTIEEDLVRYKIR